VIKLPFLDDSAALDRNLNTEQGTGKPSSRLITWVGLE